MVTDSGSKADIEHGLITMAFAVAIACSVLLLILLVLFKSEPPTPPSLAQLKIKESDEESIGFLKTLTQLLSNPSYVSILIANGTVTGVFYALSTLLNQIILEYYPGASKDAGIIGLVIILSGMIGVLIFGAILDKFKLFKESTIALYFISLLAMIAFTFTLGQRLQVIYVVSALLGLFLTTTTPLAFNLAVELTYPLAEGTSGGLITVAAQICGIAFTYLYSFLFYNVAHLWSHLAMSALIFIALVLVCCIRYDLQRQMAQNKNF